MVLTVRHTAGHTPEHISLLVAKQDRQESPFAVLSGGSLLVEAAGRTDLLGNERVEELTRAQFKTLRDFFLSLDEGVQVYPTHVSWLALWRGHRRQDQHHHRIRARHNPLLQHTDEAAFAKRRSATCRPKPRYYPRLKERNTWRPAETRCRPPPCARCLRRRSAARWNEAGAVVLDTRHLLSFGGAHVPRAWNIGATGQLGIWAGWMLEPDRPLLLVLESDGMLDRVVAHLARTGFERLEGYLSGGMSAWENAGFPLQTLPQLHVTEAAAQCRQGTLSLLDVRSAQEWKQGHAPGAVHVFLPDLPSKLGELPKGRRIAVYCDSGYRASIAASLLQASGFDVANIPGSWQAWKASQLPLEDGSKVPAGD